MNVPAFDEIAAEQLRERVAVHGIDMEAAHQVADAFVAELLRQAGFAETAKLYDQLREGYWYG